MSSVTTQDEHRQALLAEMHPALRQLYQQQCVLDGRFRITDVVGVGGFASVLQCVDLQSGPAKLQVRQRGSRLRPPRRVCCGAAATRCRRQLAAACACCASGRAESGPCPLHAAIPYAAHVPACTRAGLHAAGSRRDNLRCAHTARRLLIMRIQVAAKVSVDAITDDAGNLSPDQMRDYKVSMKHESAVYKALLAGCVAGSPPPGIPAVYGAGAGQQPPPAAQPLAGCVHGLCSHVLHAHARAQPPSTPRQPAATATLAACVRAVYTKRAFDAACPKKMCFLSFLVMELLGKDAWHLACEQQAYKDNQALLVAHALSMLKVHARTAGCARLQPVWCMRRAHTLWLPPRCTPRTPGAAQALQHMHSRGYVHRDVKPENFCLPTDCSLQQPGMQLRIVDMGMAMLWQHKGARGMNVSAVACAHRRGPAQQPSCRSRRLQLAAARRTLLWHRGFRVRAVAAQPPPDAAGRPGGPGLRAAGDGQG